MAEPQNIVEQCLAVLTDILSRQNQPQSLRSRIEKEIRYLPTFEGRPGTLPAFIASVERALAEYGAQSPQVYNVIYNEKILGPAKNYLETLPPPTWEECKAKLKLQYKSTKDQGRIVFDINNLKVSSIIELLDKIRIIVEDISECAIFSDYQSEIINNLSSVLVLKIKEITAGALAAEIYNKYSLEEIRAIINKYIGQDQYNLKISKSNFFIKDKQNISRQNQNNKDNNNQVGQSRHNNHNSGQYRQNGNLNTNTTHHRQNNISNNYSGQYRQNNNFAQNRPNNYSNNYNNNRNEPIRNQVQNRNSNQVQPMEIDTLSTNNEVNQLGENEFFIN